MQLPLAVQFLFDHFYLFLEYFVFLLGHICLHSCVGVVLLLGSVTEGVPWSWHLLHLILHHFLHDRGFLLLRVLCHLLGLSGVPGTLFERLKRQSTKFLLLLPEMFDQILKLCNFALIFLTLAKVPTPLFALLGQVECEGGYLFPEFFNLWMLILFNRIHALARSIERNVVSGVVEGVSLVIALDGVDLKLGQDLVVLVEDGGTNSRGGVFVL